MQLAEIAVFVAITDSRSLSAAARKLGLSPMTVSRRLTSLEDTLGVRLLHRTTRSVSLTPEGESFLPYAQTMLEAEEAARRTLATDSGSATGLLRLTAPVVFGHSVIMPFIPELIANNPLLRFDCVFSDSLIDIPGAGLDLGIRIADLRDSSMVARKITANPMVLCAAPSYLARYGLPKNLEGLKKHSCIALHLMPQWSFSADHVVRSHKPEGVFSSSNVDGVRTACLQGLGITLLSFWDVKAQLANGLLQLIELDGAKPKASNVWALFPTRQYIPARVQVFLKALQDAVDSPEMQDYL